MTPRQVNLLTALGLIALLAVVTLTAPRWSRFLRQPLAAAPEDDGASEGAEAGASTARAMEPEGERRISVRLYFESADQGGGLVPEERSVPLAGDLARQIQTVMTELVRGSTTGLLPTLPAEAHVLEAFVSARGIAYIDFSPEIRQAALGGSQAELVAVYSIVNSVAANFPAVKKVQILVEDKPVTTLSGHVDLSRPLGPDMTFLALPSPSPSASAGAVPTP